MKKSILFLIACMFAITAQASSNKELCSMSALEYKTNFYIEGRNDKRPLAERLQFLENRMCFDFKEVKLTLLNPKEMPSSESDPNKIIQLLELKKTSLK